MPTLHVEPLATRYHTPLCSRTFLLVLLLFAATLILPFVLAYSSQSFWLKENSYREQPSVVFKHSLLLLLEGTRPVSGVLVPFHIAWSTDPLYTRMTRSVLRTPTVKTTDVDEDRDGKNDYLQFSISMPAFVGENIHHARLALIFQYNLEDSVRLSMESMALIDSSSSFSGSSLTVNGDLRLHQRRIPGDKQILVNLDGPVFNSSVGSGADTTAWTWSHLVEKYMERDVRTDVVVPYPIWMSDRGDNQPFVLSGKIRYAEDRIYYRPGVLEVLKQGWIQYLSFLVLAVLVAVPLLSFLVQNQFLSTRVSIDRIPARASRVGPKSHHF